MNFLESEYFLLGARLLALNLIGAVIIELLHRRILKSFPRIDQSKYSNNITPQLLIEFREKKIALANSLRKFFHLSVTSFLFLFITSVIPGYFYFPVIVIAWTRFYYRWESLRFKYHIESAERHKEAPPLERIKQLETLKSNTMNFAYFILILGCLWLYQSQITNRNYRESFLESSITLLNSEWCATDEYDFNVYGTYTMQVGPASRSAESRMLVLNLETSRMLLVLISYLRRKLDPLAEIHSV